MYTEKLAKMGIDVETMFFSRRVGPSERLLGRALMKTLSASPRHLLRTLSIVRKELARHHTDTVMFLGGAETLIGFSLLLYARARGIKTAALFYGKDILNDRKSLLKRFLLLSANLLSDLVLTNSVYTSTLVPRLARSKSRVLYPAVDPSSWNLAVVQQPDGPASILFVGRLVSRKGVDDLIRAFANLASRVPEVFLEIVGDGPERRPLESLAGSLRLLKRIRFKGELRGKALSESYARAAFFVAPSKSSTDDIEGFGTVFLEAALFGKASIGTRSGGIPEAIIDGVTGVLVPEGDTKALEEAMRRLLLNKELRERLGRNGKRRVLESFTLEGSSKRLVDILSGTAGSG